MKFQNLALLSASVAIAVARPALVEDQAGKRDLLQHATDKSMFAALDGHNVNDAGPAAEIKLSERKGFKYYAWNEAS